MGNHPTVTRLLQGVFNSRPPQPRYTAFWDVGVVIQHIKGLGANTDLNLKELTMKTVMLLALTRPSRSADLSRLNLQMRSFKSNGVVFRPAHLAKQSRSSKPMADFFFPSFDDDPTICPMVTLRAYEERTEGFRANLPIDSRYRLFLSYTGQHTPVSSTIARWLKSFMAEAGIDISIFKAHSVEGHCAPLLWGLELQPRIFWMLQTGHQKAPSKDFIVESLKRMTKPLLVLQFCHLIHLQTIHVDMELSLPKCNL